MQTGLSTYLRSLATSYISTAPSAFSRPGQPETRQRPRRKRRFYGKPSLMPIGPRSKAKAALAGARIDRQFPSLRVKQMPPNGETGYNLTVFTIRFHDFRYAHRLSLRGQISRRCG